MSLLKRTGTAIDDVTWDATELASKAELDAVKKTADSAKSTADTAKGVADAALPKAGGTMAGAINMNDKQVKNVGTPTDVNDAVTKKYVDDALSGVQPVGDYVNKSGDTMTGNLNMGNHQINNVNTMTVSNVIVKGTADSQVSIKTTGDASRSEIDLNDASDNPVVIKGVDTPADDMDAANKSYVDAVDAKVTAANAEITGVKNTVNGVVDGSVELPYLPLSGGSLSGSLELKSNVKHSTPTGSRMAASITETASYGTGTSDLGKYNILDYQAESAYTGINEDIVITGIATPDSAPDNAVATKGYVDKRHTFEEQTASVTFKPGAHGRGINLLFDNNNRIITGLHLKKGYGILLIQVSLAPDTDDFFAGLDLVLQGVVFGNTVQSDCSYKTSTKYFMIPYVAFREVTADDEIGVAYYEINTEATPAAAELTFTVTHVLHIAEI